MSGYGFDEIELSNEDPEGKLTFEDWVVLCAGNEALARHYLEFSPDVAEPLKVRWMELPIAPHLHGLLDTDPMNSPPRAQWT